MAIKEHHVYTQKLVLWKWYSLPQSLETTLWHWRTARAMQGAVPTRHPPALDACICPCCQLPNMGFGTPDQAAMSPKKKMQSFLESLKNQLHNSNLAKLWGGKKVPIVGAAGVLHVQHLDGEMHTHWWCKRMKIQVWKGVRKHRKVEGVEGKVKRLRGGKKVLKTPIP